MCVCFFFLFFLFFSRYCQIQDDQQIAFRNISYLIKKITAYIYILNERFPMLDFPKSIYCLIGSFN